MINISPKFQPDVLGMVDQGWQFLDAEASLVKQKLYDKTYVPLSITLSEDVKRHIRTIQSLT